MHVDNVDAIHGEATVGALKHSRAPALALIVQVVGERLLGGDKVARNLQLPRIDLVSGWTAGIGVTAWLVAYLIDDIVEAVGPPHDFRGVRTLPPEDPGVAQLGAGAVGSVSA